MENAPAALLRLHRGAENVAGAQRLLSRQGTRVWGAVETVQLVKDLAHEREDLSLDPQLSHKRLGEVACPVTPNPRAKEAEDRGSLGLVGQTI